MKTISQHNDSIRYPKAVLERAGVLCNRCGIEMQILSRPAKVYGEYPHAKVVCPKCGTHDILLLGPIINVGMRYDKSDPTHAKTVIG